MSIEGEYCSDKVEWMDANGGRRGHPETHAFDFTSGPKGDYCYWCGKHRSGDGRVRPDAGTFTDDDWWNDAIAYGIKEEP